MMPLIYRDWIVIKKTKAMYIGLLYLLFLIPNSGNSFMINYSTNFLFIFVAYLFFSYLTAYDYKYNGLAFSAAFPVSKKEIVESRYAFIGLAFLSYLGILVLFKTIMNALQGNGSTIDYRQIGFYIIIFSIFFSVIIPLYYKLGYQKIRWVMFIGMFMAAIFSSLFAEANLVFDAPTFLMIACIVGSSLYWYSSRVSCKIIKMKDL
ncbi:MAG: ABC-2 transporter permease [Clostridia bacterium]|nr:ABC-2 transporter permease [Clostridia bacterium]